MNTILPALALALLLACPGGARAADEPATPVDVVEDAARLAVTIGGKDYALGAVVVRLPGESRLPVALVTHGASPGKPRAATIDGIRGWAHDLAHRGWLAVAVMRRGYGESDGEVTDNGDTCTSPDVGRYLEAHADDLEAALRSIGRRPDADMDRVLALGASAGAAAVMALAARPSARLAAVVNVSGGLTPLGPFQRDPACAPYEADLVWNFARFGRTAHMPTLWLYAENDGLFRPGLVSRMRSAFAGTGGRAELVMLPPFRDDGHALFYAWGGKRRLLPELDRFLRANKLPTWDESAFEPLLARLSFADAQAVQQYLQSLAAEKALALAPGGGVHWWQGAPTAAEARSSVLADCRKKRGVDCTLAAENYRPLVQAPPEAAARPSP